MNQLLDELFGSIQTYAFPYPRTLPAELERWHLHTVDQGHCLAVAIASRYDTGDPAEFLVPIPVRAVRRMGYEIRDGYIICDLTYDRVFGVDGDFSADLEFGR